MERLAQLPCLYPPTFPMVQISGILDRHLNLSTHCAGASQSGFHNSLPSLTEAKSEQRFCQAAPNIFAPAVSPNKFMISCAQKAHKKLLVPHDLNWLRACTNRVDVGVEKGHLAAFCQTLSQNCLHLQSVRSNSARNPCIWSRKPW